MSLTPSNMMPPGTKAPYFELVDTVSGDLVSLQDVKSDAATVVMFVCNHCPYVLHILDEVVAIAKLYQTKGIQFVAINSNDVVGYPEDSPEKMKQLAVKDGFTFPYLYDEDQTIAKVYQAACTPEFYVFDNSFKCFYHGRFDAAMPGNDVPVTGIDLMQALDKALAAEPIPDNQMPSMGCNIKWKKDF